MDFGSSIVGKIGGGARYFKKMNGEKRKKLEKVSEKWQKVLEIEL